MRAAAKLETTILEPLNARKYPQKSLVWILWCSRITVAYSGAALETILVSAYNPEGITSNLLRVQVSQPVEHCLCGVCRRCLRPSSMSAYESFCAPEAALQ